MAKLCYIDNSGRMMLDGFHVGWVRKEAGLERIQELCLELNVPHIPMLSDMASLQEADKFGE
jgi:hypothetical protein